MPIWDGLVSKLEFQDANREWQDLTEYLARTDTDTYFVHVYMTRHIDAPLRERVEKGVISAFEAMCIQAFHDAGAHPMVRKQPIQVVVEYGDKLGELIEFFE